MNLKKAWRLAGQRITSPVLSTVKQDRTTVQPPMSSIFLNLWTASVNTETSMFTGSRAPILQRAFLPEAEVQGGDLCFMNSRFRSLNWKDFVPGLRNASNTVGRSAKRSA